MPIPHPDARLDDWLTAIAAPAAAPAGGAAAAIAGGLAAALAQMVAGLTGARERYAAVHAEAARVEAQAAHLRDTMLALAVRDAKAFEGFTRALALPAATPEERAARAQAKADALRVGAAVQLELLAQLDQVTALAEAMAERGLAGALGDAATAVFLSAGAARSAYWAVRSNLADAGDGTAAGGEWLATAKGLLDRVEETERRTRHLLDQRVG